MRLALVLATTAAVLVAAPALAEAPKPKPAPPKPASDAAHRVILIADGGSARTVAGVTYVAKPNGESATFQKTGETIYGSDGTNARSDGKNTVINTPEGKTVNCRTVNGTAYCS